MAQLMLVTFITKLYKYFLDSIYKWDYDDTTSCIIIKHVLIRALSVFPVNRLKTAQPSIL